MDAPLIGSIKGWELRFRLRWRRVFFSGTRYILCCRNCVTWYANRMEDNRFIEGLWNLRRKKGGGGVSFFSFSRARAEIGVLRGNVFFVLFQGGRGGGGGDWCRLYNIVFFFWNWRELMKMDCTKNKKKKKIRIFVFIFSFVRSQNRLEKLKKITSAIFMKHYYKLARSWIVS